MKSAKTPNMPSALHKFKPRLARGFFRMTVVKERPYDASHPPQSLLSFWLMLRQNSLRCGPPSPAERALYCVSVLFGYSFGAVIMSLPRWGRGTAAEEFRGNAAK